MDEFFAGWRGLFLAEAWNGGRAEERAKGGKNERIGPSLLRRGCTDHLGTARSPGPGSRLEGLLRLLLLLAGNQVT